MRGFIQGALESPALCKAMMNTLLELLGLKATGFKLWAPDGCGMEALQLVYADDAANGTQTFGMLQRVARLWEVWSIIVGVDINIAGLKKKASSLGVWEGAGLPRVVGN